MWPFRSVDPVWSLLFLSFLSGIAILVIFRYTSDQKGIKETKNKIKAHLLEIRLFKDNLAIQFSAQKRLFFYNAIYMKHAVRPLLFLIIPVGLLILQIDAWYGQKPLRPGESAIFSVFLAKNTPARMPSDVSIDVDGGLTVETAPLRIKESGEFNWRVRADEIGKHRVLIKTTEHTFYKDIIVANGVLNRVSPVSVDTDQWNSIFTPGVEPLPHNARLKKIEIRYQPRSIEVFGWRVHWLIVFFVLTTVIAFAFKNLFKVEI
jgi:hypothetical protein